MASRVHLPADHNHTTECFKRQSDAGFGTNDTVSIAAPSWPSWSDAGRLVWVRPEGQPERVRGVLTVLDFYDDGSGDEYPVFGVLVVVEPRGPVLDLAGAAEWGFVGVSEPLQPHTRLDWWAVGHRAVEYACVAVLGGMAALRVWGASC